MKEHAENELISVVIPFRRYDRMIRKAIISAVNQEKVSVEIIVVEDGKGISEKEFIKRTGIEKFCDTGRFKFVPMDKNEGPASARNRGVEAANGEYIAFLDADDWWQRDKLYKQLELYKSYQKVGELPRFVYTGRVLCKPDGKSTGHVIFAPERIEYRDLLKHNSVNCSSVFMTRSVAMEYPMKRIKGTHEDYLCWLEILKAGGFAAGLKYPYLRYRLTRHSLSGNKLKSAVMTYRVYKYMDMPFTRRIKSFISYAIHGIFKYI